MLANLKHASFNKLERTLLDENLQPSLINTSTHTRIFQPLQERPKDKTL
jgi:hypothetical protein